MKEISGLEKISEVFLTFSQELIIYVSGSQFPRPPHEKLVSLLLTTTVKLL